PHNNRAPRIAMAHTLNARTLEECLPRLRRFALKLTRNAEQAEDLTQTTLLRAWRYKDDFRGDGSVMTWTYKIMRNAFYNDRRDAKKCREVMAAYVHEQPATHSAPPQEHRVALARAGACLDKTRPGLQPAR